MHPPKIFISATSGDLGSVRQIVKEALLTINCHPVEQTNFEPDARTVENMLRGKIGDCQALIHICGMRYGAEPDVATLPPGTPRRSYTQMEYHLARQLQEQRGDDHFRVYTFICPEDFPYDPEPDVESAEKRDLQHAHRSRLFDDPHLREKPKTSDDLRLRILALQEQVLALKQEQAAVKTEVIRNRHLGLKAFAVFFLLVGGIGFWQWQMKKDTRSVQKDTKALVTGQADIGEQMSQVQEALSRIQQQTDPQRDPISGWSHERLEKELARHMNWKEEDLRALLSTAKTSLDALVAGQALLASGKAEEAEQKFDTVIAQEQSARQRLIQAYRGKAQISDGKAHYNVALDYHQKAAALTSRSEDPVAWAAAQMSIGLSLQILGRYRESELLLREILSLYEQHPGENAPMTAFSLSILSGTLAKIDRRSEEAEASIRRALVIFEKEYPPHHPYIETCLVNLGQLLLRANKLKEAEELFKRILSDSENRYGPDDISVAKALSNVAWLYMFSDRYELAEPLFRRALEISKSKLGTDHPSVAISLSDLAQSLVETNRAAEAEPLIDQALLIVELKYGPENPKVADQLNIKVRLLQAMDRQPEIEPLLRRSLSIREAVYSIDHPSIVMDRYILALFLLQLNKLDESEVLLRRVITSAVEIKQSTGHKHPNFGSMIAAYRRVLTLRNLSEDQVNIRLREVLGPDLARTIYGPFQVVVTEVVKGGQGESLGMQDGDAYVSYDGQAVTSVEQFIRLTGEAEGDAIPIEVLRNAKKLNFTAKPGKLGTVIQNRPK